MSLYTIVCPPLFLDWMKFYKADKSRYRPCLHLDDCQYHIFVYLQVRCRELAPVPPTVPVVPGNLRGGAPPPLRPDHQTPLQHCQSERGPGRGRPAAHGGGEAVHADSRLVNCELAQLCNDGKARGDTKVYTIYPNYFVRIDLPS